MKKLFPLACVLIGTMLISCSNEKEKETGLVITPTSINCHFNENTQINVVSGKDVTFKSSDEFVAQVSENGLVIALHIGSTNIIASSGNEKAVCKVTVSPKYSLFEEPTLNWSLTMDDIYSTIGIEYDTKWINKYRHMYYKVKEGMMVDYIISNNGNGTLSGVVYEMDPAYYTAEEVVGYAYERYTYMTKSGDDYVFVKGQSPNYSAMISVGVSSSGKYRITYLPYN